MSYKRSKAHASIETYPLFDPRELSGASESRTEAECPPGAEPETVRCGLDAANLISRLQLDAKSELSAQLRGTHRSNESHVIGYRFNFHRGITR